MTWTTEFTVKNVTLVFDAKPQSDPPSFVTLFNSHLKYFILRVWFGIFL